MVLALDHVTVRRDGTTTLDDVSLRVRHDERWVVLGPNGSGKTTMLRVAALALRPASGTVEVSGNRLGSVDVRMIRPTIGVLSPSVGEQLRPGLSAHDAVLTAVHAALEPWWHRYDDADHERADRCLAQLGVRTFRDRALGTLSSGERQRVLIARTLMTDPVLLLLDEPTAGLDVAGREQVVGALDEMACDRAAPAMVLVSHHLEEVPPHVTHALLLRDGRVDACGRVDDVLDGEHLSRTFAIDLRVERADDGRFRAWASARRGARRAPSWRA
ncbi:MAG: ATP-binding cassette domain-containing protein [Actinomycetota bacterium]|nr:ATP-binding cassette domain-containing protein [Actinomycetota bacterium]